MTRVETLLSNVVDKYAAGDHVVHDYLDSAIHSVVSAKNTLDTAAPDGSAKKSSVKTAKTASGVKKGNAAPKRKPNGADSGRQLTRTA